MSVSVSVRRECVLLRSDRSKRSDRYRPKTANLNHRDMKATNYFFPFLLLLSISAGAQETKAVTFTATVSTDSVILGYSYELTFTLENAEGTHFAEPSFDDFDLVSGPNTSMQTQILNGVVSQKRSYSYYLQPREVGLFYVGPASIETGEGVLETAPIEILVVPNPDNIIQRPERKTDFFQFGDPWFREIQPPAEQPEPPAPPRKKRKITKI